MRRKNQYALAVLLLSTVLAMWLVVSCASAPEPVVPNEGAASQWDEAIDSTITDSRRANRLKRLGHQLSDLADSISSDIESLNEKLMALNADYHATTEQKQQLIGEFTQKRNDAFDQYRDIIFAMRGQVSAEEWEQLTE